MPDDLATTIGAVVQRLISLAMGDAELRASLRQLAEQFLTQTAPPPTLIEETGTGQSVEVEAVVLPEPPSPAPLPPPTHEPLPAVPGVEVPLGWVKRTSVADVDLQVIEGRCRLKAEGARWAATRQRKLREGVDFYTEIEPKDRELIDKAKALPDCFLWMAHSSGPCPEDLELWEDVAGCFEAAAMAVALLRQVIENGEKYRGFLEKAIDLTAEAQSALRMAVEVVDGKPDSDQHTMFNWLRQMVAEEQIFIARFMRLDDPADPTRWNDMQERIGQLDSEIEEIRQRDKQRIKMLKKAQFHARIIGNRKGTEADWKKVIEVIDTLVSEGMPASNTDLRDMLVPVVDDIPEVELHDGFQRVLVEVDRYLATQVPPAQKIVREISEEVRKLADLYKGKAMVLIGGDRRPHAYEALKSAFSLKELIWIATRDHESTDIFVPYISRTDVDVVLLAIRWSSHSYGDVKVICDKFGKEFYRLPAGYNPNQVAHQILQHRGK